MRKISLLAMVVVMMVGCEQRPGMETQEEHITKGEVAIYVAGTMLGYDLNDNSWACTSTFTDVEDNTPLCRAIEVHKTRDMSNSYVPWYDSSQQSEFFPEQMVIWMVLWQYIGPELGYPDYSNPCIATFTDQSPTGSIWIWVGALCNKNIIREGDVLDYTAYVTREGWNAFTSRIDEFLNGTSNRMFTIETLGKVYVPDEIEIMMPYWCLSPFSDIPNDTLNCSIALSMYDMGYVNGDPAGNTFRPFDHVNKAELVKWNVLVNDYYTPQETGCYGAQTGQWYAQYMDILCEEGYLDTDNAPADASEAVTNRDVVWLASDLKLLHPRY